MNENLTPGPLTRPRAGAMEMGAFTTRRFGARQQMGVIRRLAYADLLKEAGRPTLVIIDDALELSDEQRMPQMKRGHPQHQDLHAGPDVIGPWPQHRKSTPAHKSAPSPANRGGFAAVATTGSIDPEQPSHLMNSLPGSRSWPSRLNRQAADTPRPSR